MPRSQEKSNNHFESNNSELNGADTLEGLVELLMDLELIDRNNALSMRSQSAEVEPETESQRGIEQESTNAVPPSNPLPDLPTAPPANSENTSNKSFNGYGKELNKYAKGIEKTKRQSQYNPIKISPDDPNFLALHQAVVNLKEKIEKLENQVYEPTELINPLLPLITELLNIKNIDSHESLMNALVPIIDEAIRQRTGQDREKMSAAIADILPTAISHEIKQSPAEIAKAIAPEMAIAIQEQIRLDPESMARTLGPEMGEAIKNQIRVEQNAMVDALYPVIGSTISKYMVEMVKSINEKVESAFSVEGIKRKIRAKLRGISEAELILQEAIKYQVQAVFLIHKASGLVIRELHPSLELRMEADMLTGLLTAIRSFVNECIVQPGEFSELHQIEYDASKIILEVAGYCYIAVVVKGEPAKDYIKTLQKTLGQIVLKYGKFISAYDGDPAAVPDSIEVLLEKLVKTGAPAKTARPPYALFAILGAIVLMGGFVLYRGHVASRMETRTSNALDAAPELSVYRITPDVRDGKLILTGRVPNEHLRDEAAQIAAEVAPNWKLDNQIIAVRVPPDPVQTAGEIERVTWIFNQQSGVAIKSDRKYGTNTVTIKGIVPDLATAERITRSFQQIPGVESVTNTVQIKPILETRIYFESGSTKYSSPDITSQLRSIRQFLEQNPSVHLRIIGHTDYRGQQPKNQELGIQRARVIQQALTVDNVNPARLHVSGSTELPPGVTLDKPLWLSRCVRFEVFIPSTSTP